jgi:hypothetical protein
MSGAIVCIDEALGRILPRSDSDQIAGWLADRTRLEQPGMVT